MSFAKFLKSNLRNRVRQSRKTGNEARKAAVAEILQTMELLESRRTPVIGANAFATVVNPGGDFDGVVALNGCSGSLLNSSGHILSAGHCVDSDGDTVANNNNNVRFDLQRSGNPVSINVPVPANMIVVHPNWGGNANLGNGSDLSILRLVDPSNQLATRMLVAPFGAQRYGIFAGNAAGLEFTMVGYGETGTGNTGQQTNEVQLVQIVNPNGGTFTLTFNGATTADIDQNATSSDVALALENLPGDVSANGPDFLVSNEGLPANTWLVRFQGYGGTDVGQMTGVGSGAASVQVVTQFDGGSGSGGTKRQGNNRIDTITNSGGAVANDFANSDFDNGNAANDALGGDTGVPGGDSGFDSRGDSGGPGFVSQAGEWRIATVVSFTNGPGNADINDYRDSANNRRRDNSFGEVNTNTYAPSFAAGFINPTIGGNFDVVIDMNFQVLGNDGLTEDLTLFARLEGGDIVVDLINTSTGVLSGEYFRAPAANVLSLTLRGSGDNETFRIDTGLGVPVTVDGRTGDNTIEGPDVDTTWNITGAGAGNVSSTNTTFTNIDRLNAGSAADTFNLVGVGALNMTIDGNDGSDTINGVTFICNITGLRAGNIQTAVVAFSGIEILNGGLNDDTFVLSPGNLSVIINGGGGVGLDRIVGPDDNTTWNITGAGSGTVSTSGVIFAEIEALTGGNATDRFMFAAAGSIAAGLDGGGGNPDTLNFAPQTARSVVLIGSAQDGYSGSVAGSIGGIFSRIDRIVGSLAGSDFLTGLDLEADWTRLSGTGKYVLASNNRTLTFVNFETMNGGSEIDRFQIAASTTFELTVNGNDPFVAAPPPPATGDELEVILAGTSNPQLVVLTPYQDGRFEFDGAHLDVSYTGIERLNNFDFGDAPDTYGTTLLSGGAQHRLGSDLKMGHVDPEADGQPTGSGLGDDNTGTPDDEDGVILPAAFIACLEARIDVLSSGAGFLDAWIDYNFDGSFSPAEQIAIGIPVIAGLNTFVIEVPDDAVAGFSFARFRLSSQGGTSPVGLAEDGEVEDHQVQLVQAPVGGVITLPDPAFPGGTLLLFGGTSGNDALIIERFHPNDTMRAIFNGNVLATFPAVGVITRTAVVAREGHDAIVLDDELPQALEACAGEGNDSIASSGGEDYLKGDAGNDSIHGLLGADRINGGDGNDVMWGAGGNDLIVAGAGHDVVYAGAGEDIVFGEAGDDALYGQGGNDIINGGGGNDRLFGNAGLDLLIGGSGRDFLFGDSSDDLMVGNATVHGDDVAALGRIRAEWTSANSYDIRIANLRTGAGPNLMGTRLDPALDVIADGVADDLFGGLDRDWFIADGLDNMFDRQANEQIN